MALLLNLSDNYLKQSQINTVVVQQKEMDRVGVEPTTSADQQFSLGSYSFKSSIYLIIKNMDESREGL